MLSVNALPGEASMFALGLELTPGAVVNGGASMLTAVAADTKLPVIISDYDSLPPDDKGDRVAVHSSILYRSRRMLGRFIDWIGPEVGLYELVKGG